jgi:hypothetical protein
MSQDDIGPLLASEQVIEPSPGFTAAVMGGVRREAETLEPIAFPWRRVLPGLVLSAAALVVGLGVLVWTLVEEPASGPAVAADVHSLLGGGHLPSAAVLAGSLLIAWLAMRLSRTSGDTLL